MFLECTQPKLFLLSIFFLFSLRLPLVPHTRVNTHVIREKFEEMTVKSEESVEREGEKDGILKEKEMEK